MVEKMIKKTSASLATKLANDETIRGGLLRCNECGKQRKPRGLYKYFQKGWPMCHGYTMIFITAKQLAEYELERIV